MSDTMVKVIPVDLSHIPPTHRHKPALDLLTSLAQRCEEPEIRVYEKVQYIDAGENETGAICPRCGHRLSFDCWPKRRGVGLVSRRCVPNR